MLKSDFYYDLPQELIAQTPPAVRQGSRLLLLDKNTGAIRHSVFEKIKESLKPGDCLVLNDTKVIPARLFAVKPATGAKVEVLLHKACADNTWEALVKPGKKVKPGDTLDFGQGLLTAQVTGVGDGGVRFLSFDYSGNFMDVLDKLGEMPLPHYITERLQDKSRYQTVYACHEGSVAAPTAGLHFTDALLEDIRQMGVHTAFVTLHVGMGTFRPVKTERVEDHHMHRESYAVPESQAQIINSAKKAGGRIIPVGTTSCRTLEAAGLEDGTVVPGVGSTDIFITPGYRFKVIDGLITNFHLPESTLIMLVSALAGREQVLAAYQEAIQERYRFFSFGDCMAIL